MIALILLGAAVCVWAEQVVVLPELIDPKTITVEGNRMYITEADSICLYSLKDFKLQKRFGRRGEGPGEFSINPARSIKISLLPDSILVDSIGKVTLFSKEGEYLKEMKAPMFGRVVPLAEKFVAQAGSMENDIMYSVVSIYKAGQNNSLEKEKELYKFKLALQRGDAKLDPIKLIRPSFVCTYQDKVFIDDGIEGEIFIFDSSGNKINTITVKYAKIPLEGKLKAEYLEAFKTHPHFKSVYEMFKSKIEFSPYLAKIRDYRVIDNNIYVLTSKRAAGKGEFYIYDIGGNLRDRIEIPLAEYDIIELYPYTIKDSKIYQLIDDQAKEQWDLHISDFSASIHKEKKK